MKSNIRLIRSGLVGLAAISSVFPVGFAALTRVAEAEQLSQAFQVPRELDQLAYFQGTWRCEQPAESPSSEPVTLTWTVKRDLSSFWYIGYAEEMRSDANREPVNSREFLGYDANAQRLVRLIVVGNGNSLNLTSLGWRSEQFVWEGSLIREGKLMPVREVITRQNNNKFTATYFIRNDANGGWQLAINEICQRQA